MDNRRPKIRPNVGKKIRLLRENAGLTQHELVRMAGMSITCLSATETGVTSPSIGTIRKISKALGVRAEDLVALVATDEPDLAEGPVSLVRNLVESGVDFTITINVKGKEVTP